MTELTYSGSMATSAPAGSSRRGLVPLAREGKAGVLAEAAMIAILLAR
jgi:hypothetical protein